MSAPIKYISIGIVLLIALFAVYWLLPSDEENSIHIAYAGSESEDGQALIRGIEPYLKAINENGGIDGKKLVLDIFDDRNDPIVARQKVLEIVEENRAIAVIGHLYSTCSTSAGEVYRQHGIPAITAVSTNVKVAAGNDWYFRMIYNDDFQGRFLAHYVKSVFG